MSASCHAGIVNLQLGESLGEWDGVVKEVEITDKAEDRAKIGVCNCAVDDFGRPLPVRTMRRGFVVAELEVRCECCCFFLSFVHSGCPMGQHWTPRSILAWASDCPGGPRDAYPTIRNVFGL
jgi:hypothetical protein